jgi:hypothetical protein
MAARVLRTGAAHDAGSLPVLRRARAVR